MKLFMALLTALSLHAGAAQAAPIIFESGQFVVSGTTYLDTSDSSDIRGIGNITEIRGADGSLFWENSLNELSIVFYDYTRTSEVSGLNGTTQFASTGGVVDFYSNAVGAFQATGDYTNDAAAISVAGALELRATGAQDQFGSTANGQFSANNYASNGYLNAQSGNWHSQLDTNTFSLANALAADISFNISGDNFATAGYDYSGSTDASISAVPIPAAAWLFGSGIAGLIGSRKLKKPNASVENIGFGGAIPA